MRKSGFLSVVGVIVGFWFLGGIPASAQVRIFLDIPKAQVAPQRIIQDSEFIGDGEETGGEAEKPAGQLTLEVAPGEIFQVPVVIMDGEEDVISYSLQALYNKKVLRIVEIDGGTFEGFAEPPVTNRASFASGKTDFTANNATFLTTPDSLNIAVLTFEVVGKLRQRTTVRLRKTPQTDFVVLPGFDPAQGVRFQRGINVVVK